MGYFLFILVNAALFIRPGEIVPDLEGLQVYLYLSVACLVVSYSQVLNRLRWASLRGDPITLAVLGLWPAVVASHLCRLSLSQAQEAGVAFGKVVLHYLLVVALVDSPGKFRRFLSWLVFFVLVTTGISVLQYYDVVDLPGFRTVKERAFDPAGSGEYEWITRMCGPGLFADPNDLCLILTLGIMLCLYKAGDRGYGAARWLWLPPVGLFGAAMLLTKSRGGLIGLLIALLMLFRARYGWWKTALFGAVLVPALLLAGGRQTSVDLSTKDNTAQERIQLWSEALLLFRQSPVFGIGTGQFAEEAGLVAHNSFIHAFAELGLFGGTLFVSAFYLGIWGVARLSPEASWGADRELCRLQPVVSAIVAGYAGGLLSLSRNYVIPTYLILGLAGAYCQLATPVSSAPTLEVNGRLVGRMGTVGVAALTIAYVWVRLVG